MANQKLSELSSGNPPVGTDLFYIARSGVSYSVTFSSMIGAIGFTGLTDNRLLRADGTTSLQDSGITVDDSDNMSGIGTLVSGDQTIGGGVSGDSITQYRDGTTLKYTVGWDLSQDSYIIANGVFDGTNDLLRANYTTGTVTITGNLEMSALHITFIDDRGVFFGNGLDAQISYISATSNITYNSQFVGTGDHEFIGGNVIVTDGDIQLPDNQKIVFGTGLDSSLTFNGTGTVFTGNESAGGATNLVLASASLSILSDTETLLVGFDSDLSIGYNNVDAIYDITTTGAHKFTGGNVSLPTIGQFLEFGAGTETHVSGLAGNLSIRGVGNTHNNIINIDTEDSATTIDINSGGTANNITFSDTGVIVSGGSLRNDAGRIKDQQALTASTLTLDGTDHIVFADASSNNITITLPAASSNAGREYEIMKTDATGNTVTIDGNASEPINGSLTQVISTQYVTIRIVCNGTEWFIM